MDGSGGYHPGRGNPITKEHTCYALTDKWILAQKLGIPKILFANHMTLKKEDQSVDMSFLLRIGNKRSMERVTEKKFGTKTEGIQTLLHSVIHTINNHQTQIQLKSQTRA